MLDVTWEAPDGTITPLDGFLDPYFQEIYLDSESIPIFSKLSQHVSANALDQYVEQLEKEDIGGRYGFWRKENMPNQFLKEYEELIIKSPEGEKLLMANGKLKENWFEYEE